jgi:RNA polymerase sigma-70 factor (ECF subfamily)
MGDYYRLEPHAAPLRGPGSQGGYPQQENPAGPNPDRVDVLAALLALPERQRQAVVLHYFLDCPIASVADLMGVSEGAVKAHLHKARGSLRLSLEVRHA